MRKSSLTRERETHTRRERERNAPPQPRQKGTNDRKKMDNKTELQSIKETE